MLRMLTLSCLLILLNACGGRQASPDDRPGRADTLASAKDSGAYPRGRALQAARLMDDWVIIPGERIGLMQADASEEVIRDMYGVEQVARRGVGVGERQTVQATVIFPDQPDELVVIWRQDALFEKIAEVRAYREDGRWHGPLSVKVGTPLEKLREINGKDFAFYGFEWDYSGLINNWRGGAVSERIQVYLTAEHPEALLPELLGDQQYPWNHPRAREAGLKVGSMVWMFDEAEPLQ